MQNLLKCNMVKAVMVLAIIMIAHPVHSACDTGCIAVGNDLKLSTCVEYQGVRYSTVLDFSQITNGFYWKLDVPNFKPLQTTESNCIPVENDLALKFCCASYQGSDYKFTLNYTPYPADPTGYYWKMDLSTFSDADQQIIVKPTLFSLEKTITADALMAHLKAFDDIANANKDTSYRLSGTPGYVKTVEYIRDKLANSGLTITEQQVVYEGVTSINLFAETTGDDNQVIIIGAHLDSVAEGPGLNDDGSGAAALLELAVQIGNNKDFKPVNKLKFAWWAFEEPGMIGSTHYVNNLSAAEKAKIGMYLNLDMIANVSPNYYFGIEDSDFSISKADPNVPPAYIDVFNAYPAYVAQNGEIKKAFAGYFENYPVPKSDIVFSALHGNMDYEAFLLNRIPFGGLYSGKDNCNHLACDNYQNINKDVLLINTKAIAYVAQFYAEKSVLFTNASNQ